MTKPNLVSVIIHFLALGILSPVSAQDWAKIQPPLEFEFPRDHGSHPSYRTEWWYVTGTISDSDETQYGYQVTFFRTGLDPGKHAEGDSNLRPRQVLFGHVALADIANGVFHNSDRFRRLDGLMAGASQQEIRLWLEDWEMVQDPGGTIRFKASIRSADINFDFTLQPTKPLVRQGQGGYSQKGDDPGNASAYLTWPRLKTAGTLKLEGREREVEGISWFDHEWGTSQLGEGVVGWDWFGLRLEDGRDLMLYRLRNEAGEATPHSSGALIAPDGTIQSLGPKDFTMTPLETWRSPESNAEYPIAWRINIPSKTLVLQIEAEIPNCELDSLGATGLVYWEGPVRVKGTISGEGYGEFTGYAGNMEGLF